MKILFMLKTYLKGRRGFLPGAMVLSALSTLCGMLPYIFIWLIARILFRVAADEAHEQISTYAWWAVGTAVAGVVLYFLALAVSHLAAFRVESRMRGDAMKRILDQPLGFFNQQTVGRIRKIIDDNVSITHGFLAHQLPDLAGTILAPLGTLVLIFVFDWRLGLSCLVPIFSAMGVMAFMMGGKGRYFMNQYMNSLEEMNTEAVEYVRGIPVVKVFQQTVFSFKNFHASILRYRDMVSEYTRNWEKSMSTYTVMINGFAFFLVPVAILLIGNTGNLAGVVLNLFFYILITPVFAQSIMRNMYLNQAGAQATEAINRMEELLSGTLLPEASEGSRPKTFDIRFKNVSFSYPGSGQRAVDGVSFTVPEGSRVALVGASGGGKTTIARMVPRFWDVDEGSVRIGGVDVRNMANEDLMDSISFVFQNSRLFKTSLQENLLFGKPDATEAEMQKALLMAQCEEILDRLPNGLDTRIGVEGTYLSGGEQQRMALARAMLKDAPIVVLDEATAFADPENEHLIQQGLRELGKGKTVLMIAHRLSSVMDADRILVIDRGKIAEEGRHEELLQKNGLYAKMWKEYKQSVRWTLGRKEVSHA